MSLPSLGRVCFFALGVLALASGEFVSPSSAQPPSEGKSASSKSGADHGIPQVRRINEETRRVWDDHKLHPSPAATEGEWCRRLYLDVLGRVPTVHELREFLSSKEADK